MPRFRNDTGSVLNSHDFGPLPPGEFDVPAYDAEVHGVIPGCTLLDAPVPDDGPAPGMPVPDDDPAEAKPKPAGRRRKPAAPDPGEETA